MLHESPAQQPRAPEGHLPPAGIPTEPSGHLVGVDGVGIGEGGKEGKGEKGGVGIGGIDTRRNGARLAARMMRLTTNNITMMEPATIRRFREMFIGLI
jgi:hypothetical protein